MSAREWIERTSSSRSIVIYLLVYKQSNACCDAQSTGMAPLLLFISTLLVASRYIPNHGGKDKKFCVERQILVLYYSIVGILRFPCQPLLQGHFSGKRGGAMLIVVVVERIAAAIGGRPFQAPNVQVPLGQSCTSGAGRRGTRR